MTRNILQITSYPTDIPRHGGQIRAHNIRRVLENEGFNVDKLAIFDQASYPISHPDINLGETGKAGPFKQYWQVGDYASGQVLAQDTSMFRELVKAIDRRQYDAVIVEEPWFGSAITRLKDEGYLRAPIIYSSYNIEHEAKRHILEEAGIAETAEIIGHIESLERNLALRSTACIAVTSDDSEVLSQWAPGPVVVARNGTTKRRTRNLQGVFHIALDPTTRYLLFVGSAHPPNVAGFSDLVLGSLRKLRSHERIVVAGSVCNPIWHLIQNTQTPFLIRDKLSLIGEVTDYALSCLIANASGLLLPITYGGGSNLKTAEALVSGKQIVATNTAFRGFEEFLGAPGVRVADDAEGFGAAIKATFDGSIDIEEERRGTESLLWDNALQPVVELVKSICRDASNICHNRINRDSNDTEKVLDTQTSLEGVSRNSLADN